jgi:hypothetical protein
MSSRPPRLHSAPDPKSFIGQVVRLPLRFVPNNRTVRVLGGINKGSRWITGSGPTHGCWLGNYEADHAIALPRIITPGSIAYDVGANVGFYTLALSRLVGESGHVFAFEPAARSVYFLRRHLELNNIGNVTVVQTAIPRLRSSRWTSKVSKSLRWRERPASSPKETSPGCWRPTLWSCGSSAVL